ncbi:3-oxoacyl-ACP reductase [Bordetella genomosp. 8]|uniref:3-oxoacyl-ACP reductase n=1 Tax=Bordetella genomosp. 8 TaxID=1416806 RepID=A0A1W6YHD0_9BORD|nr:SDR family oxidoreductase [Bordetella genomosp. 8]ARP80418.1 3-oxoacyl-ACP reductase [Bordetella genomosp. 8]
MKGRLEGKVCLLMGGGATLAGSGFSNGQAAALTFARQGASLVVVDVRLEAARDTVTQLALEGYEAIAVRADVSRRDDVAAAVAATMERHGRIDILYNNVGIEYRGGPVETPEEAWDHVHDVNIKSVFLACKQVIPIMERQGGGAIVNISSTASLRWGGLAYISYNSSKAALNHMSRIIARQYAEKRIRCNVVVPGLIDTPHVRVLYGNANPQEFDAIMKDRDARCPMGRQGTCWDVANAALFLASDEASYVSGALLVVDGALSV